jgi:aminopeptidase N
MAKAVKRLIKQFKPSRYDLSIEIDEQSMTFSGTVIISGSKLGRPSQRITLHQKSLNVTAARITKHQKDGDIDVPVDRINLHKSADEVRFHSNSLMPHGQYTLRINFNGKITEQMHGLYPSKFKQDGKDMQIFATQFESHHAREVLPCIDEPEAKAVFQLTLMTPIDKTVLSNTPVLSSSHEGDLLTTKFEATPHMSTYLLAFVYGDMGYIEAKTKNGTVVRTYATKDNVAFTDFSLEVAVKCLDFYEDYFGIAYPLEKCDFIALPDFSSGAMENWGCITFREQTMLVDPNNSTLSTKQYVALVVAHELAHQWFGNLVTMHWWTDLWLNEGFASWIEYLAVDHIFPEWDVWTQFIVDEQQQALKMDALEHTHPIEVEVNHPDEIRTIFDIISYSKGASVIHMLHDYLGPKDFRNGLRQYLEQHKYKNTATTDLWESLEQSSGKPVKEFMDKWTSTPGFPILNANVSVSGITLNQERFFINPTRSKTKPQLWPVPLLSNSDSLPAAFDKPELKVKSSNNTDLMLNAGQSGFYRIVYNTAQLEHYGQQIRRGELDTVDRIGLLNDTFEAAKAGLTDTVTALEFLKNFENESEFPVWDSMTSAIASLRIVMDDEDLRREMKPYIRNLVAKQLERLGWEASAADSHFDKLLRPIILGLAASADVPEVISHCKKLFDNTTHPEDLTPDEKTIPSKRIKRGLDIDPDLRGIVFGTIARLGGKEEFDKLVTLHNTSTLTEEKTTLAAAITNFKDPTLYNKALAMIKGDEVRLQDATYWIAYSFGNRFARKATWGWVKKNWGWLEENFGNELSFYRMPIYAARVSSDEAFIEDYKKFFEPKLSLALERSYNQGIEIMSYQSAWKKRSLKEVKTFFKNQSR